MFFNKNKKINHEKNRYTIDSFFPFVRYGTTTVFREELFGVELGTFNFFWIVSAEDDFDELEKTSFTIFFQEEGEKYGKVGFAKWGDLEKYGMDKVKVLEKKAINIFGSTHEASWTLVQDKNEKWSLYDQEKKISTHTHLELLTLERFYKKSRKFKKQAAALAEDIWGGGKWGHKRIMREFKKAFL